MERYRAARRRFVVARFLVIFGGLKVNVCSWSLPYFPDHRSILIGLAAFSVALMLISLIVAVYGVLPAVRTLIKDGSYVDQGAEFFLLGAVFIPVAGMVFGGLGAAVFNHRTKSEGVRVTRPLTDPIVAATVLYHSATIAWGIWG